MAAGAGVPVYLDAGGVEGGISERLLAALTVLSPNETELARLTGLPTQTLAECEAAARALQVSWRPRRRRASGERAPARRR